MRGDFFVEWVAAVQKISWSDFFLGVFDCGLVCFEIANFFVQVLFGDFLRVVDVAIEVENRVERQLVDEVVFGEESLAPVDLAVAEGSSCGDEKSACEDYEEEKSFAEIEDAQLGFLRFDFDNQVRKVEVEGAHEQERERIPDDGEVGVDHLPQNAEVVVEIFDAGEVQV